MGLEISTVAFGSVAPDGSLTTPSIDPELPNCALSGAAQNTKSKLKADHAIQRKVRIIFPPSQQRDVCLGWIGAAKRNGGRPSSDAARREETATEISGSDYAEGGPRDARCSEKESSGEAFSGRTVCQATCRASGIRSRGAAANAGMCSAWQVWPAGSGPPRG